MSAHKNIYERIKNMIFEGAIAPGEKIVERRMAEELGSSRVPVREALQRLQLEGLLVNRPGMGLVTRSYHEQDVLDLFFYREPLDGVAARLFTMRADKVEHEFLTAIFSGFEARVESVDIPAIRDIDFEFHKAIARGSRNKRLEDELGKLYQECVYISRTMFGGVASAVPADEYEGMQRNLLEEHRRIYRAILDQDPAAAEEAARSSVRRGAARIMTRFAGRMIRGDDE